MLIAMPEAGQIQDITYQAVTLAHPESAEDLTQALALPALHTSPRQLRVAKQARRAKVIAIAELSILEARALILGSAGLAEYRFTIKIFPETHTGKHPIPVA
jgi:hypothetical protein